MPSRDAAKPPAPPTAEDLPDLLGDIQELASTAGADWFADLDTPRVRVTLLESRFRPRCVLHRVALDDGRRRHEVVVKMRHDNALRRRDDRYAGQRPVLTPERVIPPDEAARREFEGLRAIGTAVRAYDPRRFDIVRPLALLPDRAALVMEHVGSPTLRSVVERSLRWRLGSRRPEVPDSVWPDVGTLLRAVHAARPDMPLHDRLLEPDDIVGYCLAARDFLRERGVAREAGLLASSLVDAWPAITSAERLAPVAGHTDFTAQNLFLTSAGRILVFDPLPLWRVPVHEDLARFTMGLRLLSFRVPGRVGGVRTAELERRERDVVTSYFGQDQVPWPAVWAFQALLLLDRWGELVSKRPRSGAVRRGARRGRVAVDSVTFRREARRLTHLLE